MKLSEHSKHEHQQRNIPPEKILQTSVLFGGSRKCVYRQGRDSPGLIKMYMGVPDYYRLNRVAWDESAELEGDKNFPIGSGSFRE